jgi:hypothetical protein
MTSAVRNPCVNRQKRAAAPRSSFFPHIIIRCRPVMITLDTAAAALYCLDIHEHAGIL